MLLIGDICIYQLSIILADKSEIVESAMCLPKWTDEATPRTVQCVWAGVLSASQSRRSAGWDIKLYSLAHWTIYSIAYL